MLPPPPATPPCRTPGAREGDAGERAPSPLPSSSWRQGSWRAAVVEDWQRLAQAPAEVRADRELLLAALPLSRGKALGHASDELRGLARLCPPF